MGEYELLEQLAHENDILFLTGELPHKMTGHFFADSSQELTVITLSPRLASRPEKTCVLAHEMGHYFTTPVDLLTAPQGLRTKYERRANLYAAKRLMPLGKLIAAKKAGVRTVFELSLFLDVTEQFLQNAIPILASHYGPKVSCEGYTISFDPLDVLAS